jgi:hypothetical protein
MPENKADTWRCEVKKRVLFVRTLPFRRGRYRISKKKITFSQSFKLAFNIFSFIE